MIRTAEQEGWIAAGLVVNAVGLFEAERIAERLMAGDYAQGFDAYLGLVQIERASTVSSNKPTA